MGGEGKRKSLSREFLRMNAELKKEVDMHRPTFPLERRYDLHCLAEIRH